ncbi:hypothetical protein BC567DRAFT_221286 [Phyllosticta citribraziliensis]
MSGTTTTTTTATNYLRLHLYHGGRILQPFASWLARSTLHRFKAPCRQSPPPPHAHLHRAGPSVRRWHSHSFH